jgi:hypothetical protein
MLAGPELTLDGDTVVSWVCKSLVTEVLEQMDFLGRVESGSISGDRSVGPVWSKSAAMTSMSVEWLDGAARELLGEGGPVIHNISEAAYVAEDVFVH